MNGSWLSLLGGSVAAVATLAVGVHLTGLATSAAPVPSPEPTTVYVEQPLVEIPAPTTGSPESLPPIVIAVIPAPTAAPSAPPAAIGSGSGGSESDTVLPSQPGGDDEHNDDGESEHEDGEGSDD